MTEYEKQMSSTERQAHEQAMRDRDSGPIGAVNRGLDMEYAEFLGRKTGKTLDRMLGRKGDDNDR